MILWSLKNALRLGAAMTASLLVAGYLSSADAQTKATPASDKAQANTAKLTPFDPPKPRKFEEDVLPETDLTNSLLFQLIASEIALQKNELGAAYSTYMAMARETGDPRLAERAAQIAQAARAPRELREAVLLWVKLAPGNKEAQDKLIQVALYYGEHDKILPTVKSYLSQVKDKETEILKLQAQLLLSKNHKKSLAFFRQATEEYKKLPQTKLGLARLEGLVGNKQVAEKLARESYRALPNTESVVTYAGILMEKNPMEAKKTFDEYLSRHPNDSKARDIYAQLLLQTRDYDKLTALTRRNPNDLDFNLSVAVNLAQKDKLNEANNILATLVTKQKKGEEQSETIQKAYLLLSDIATEEKQYAKAIEYCDLVTGKLKPVAALQRANLHFKMGEGELALRELENIATSNNLLIMEEVIISQAKILSEIRDDQTALKKLEEGLKENPASRNLNYDAAMVAERLGLVAKVEKYLKKAIEVDPNFANAYNSLGYTLLEKTKRTKEAAQYIETAYSLEPNNPYILDSMGWLKFKQKKYSQALQYLKQAMEIMKDEDIVLHLIEVYCANNQKPRAQELLKEAEVLWPNSHELESLVKKLKLK